MVTKVSEELVFSIFSVALDYPDLNFILLIYLCNSGFPTKILYAFLMSHMHDICPLISLLFI